VTMLVVGVMVGSLLVGLSFGERIVPSRQLAPPSPSSAYHMQPRAARDIGTMGHAMSPEK